MINSKAIIDEIDSLSLSLSLSLSQIHVIAIDTLVLQSPSFDGVSFSSLMDHEVFYKKKEKQLQFNFKHLINVSNDSTFQIKNKFRKKHPNIHSPSD